MITLGLLLVSVAVQSGAKSPPATPGNLLLQFADNKFDYSTLYSHSRIDMAFPSNTYVRNHLGLAHQWENVGGVTARGFRIDLVSLGYPIPLVTSKVRLDLEPILTVVRGEVMFVNNGPRFLRLESGFSLELSATVQRWFVMVQAFGIDFRYWVYGSGSLGSMTGFSRVFPLKFAVGHEF